jgi:hypothetical protein
MAAASPFGRADIKEAAIGFDVWLRKWSASDCADATT